MDFKLFFTVFTAIFIAELGDKTQLATLLFATDKNVSKLAIFLGSSTALILTSALGVIIGSALSHYFNEKVMTVLSGVIFVFLGIFTLYKGLATG